jgi:hypothetical protein
VIERVFGSRKELKLVKTRILLIAVFGAVVGLGQEQPKPKRNSDRAEWMYEAQWGVFCHYLSDIALKGQEHTPENWNAAVDSFDVEALAEQLASVKARYFVLTLGQNSGYYCSPNAAYDRIVGNAASTCARRDLVADLADALVLRGIRLMVYLPAGAPDRDPKAMQALEWAPGKYPIWSHPEGGPEGGDPRFDAFQRKWEEIIGEWSTRWGANVSGWWFDGCYYPIAMYQHDDPPNFASFAGAARAGNPDSIVAFNPGVFDPVITLSSEEDYTAGEINDAEKVQCPGRWLNGAQFQMLSFLGPQWAGSPPRYSDEQVIAITRRILTDGGIVTWEVPISTTGVIPAEFVAQLNALGASLENEPVERE